MGDDLAADLGEGASNAVAAGAIGTVHGMAADSCEEASHAVDGTTANCMKCCGHPYAAATISRTYTIGTLGWKVAVTDIGNG